MKIIDSYQKAIRTEYKGPTNTQGSRIVAKCGAEGKKMSMTIPYDHALSSSENHANAARKFAEKLSWNCTEMICGWYDNCGFFVFSK
ncbi:MAG: hypothetical protein ACO3F3_15940 [Gemmataceae bacterium]